MYLLLTDDRLRRHDSVSVALSRLSGDEFAALIAGSIPLAIGIGGNSSRIDVDGIPVFVKQVPLTDLERSPHHVRSTANLFGLPLGCHYGVGAPSFGVWREVAANEIATASMLSGRTAAFPLLHHWRAIAGIASAQAVADELADVDNVVEYWHGSEAIRRRIEALAASSASVAMCFEFVPTTLPVWLDEQIDAGGETAERAVTMIAEHLAADVAAMNTVGLFHFDAHLGNILTDGQQLYLADFGLAVSPMFDLEPQEREFLAANVSHDACHTMAKFVDWLTTKLAGPADWQHRDRMIEAIADGARVSVPVHAAAVVIERYAPMATVLNDFYRTLHLDDRTAAYPAARLEAVSKEIGFNVMSGLTSLR